MRKLLLAILLTLTTAILFGADLTGTWSGASDAGPNFVFTLKSADKALTGTMRGEGDKEFPISEAKVDGDNVAFAVNSEYQGNPVKLVFKGKVSGSEMHGHIGTDDDSWGTDLALRKAN